MKRAYSKEPEILNELLLNVHVPDAFFDRIKFMKAFFEVCQKKEHLLAKVARYGLSSEKIAAALEKITQIEKDAIDKSTLIMEAEKATQDRNNIKWDRQRFCYLPGRCHGTVFGNGSCS